MKEKQENFTLLNGRVNMKRSKYNPTSDAVWLAAIAPNGAKTVLDVGIGTGGVSLCLLEHNPEMQITGIDISSSMLNNCVENAELNNRQIKIFNQDIFKWSTPEVFDLVITNPPYFRGTPSTKNPTAHHNIDICQWTKRCIARAKPNGVFCTIIDAVMLDKVIHVLYSKHVGNIEIFPLFGAKKSAERVLIRAKKSVKTGPTIYKGSSMNNDAILRDGLTIDALLGTVENND